MVSGNKCVWVCVAILVAESPAVYLIQLLEYFLSGSCLVARSENMSQITILEIDYTDTTTRVNMTTVDL